VAPPYRRGHELDAMFNWDGYTFARISFGGRKAPAREESSPGYGAVFMEFAQLPVSVGSSGALATVAFA
jgi:hypothetical protein